MQHTAHLIAVPGLPKFRGFELRNNPKYPHTAAWYAAINSRPAYQKVCSDDQTLQLLFQVSTAAATTLDCGFDMHFAERFTKATSTLISLHFGGAGG